MLTFTLTVTDDDGATTTDTVDITIQPDTDLDGIADATDNCPAVANGDQLNTDGDTQGNACDTDDDNDGLLDTYENQYSFLDPLDSSDAALDQDSDGLTNLQEPAVRHRAG